MAGWTRLAVCAGLLAALSAAVPFAAAQEAAAPVPKPAATPLFRVSDAEKSPAEHMSLPAGSARILEFETDVRDILTSAPDIAEVVIKTPRRLYLLGVKVGNTNVFVFDRAGNQLLRLEVKVTRNLDPVREALEKLIPNEKIEVTSVNNTIVLSGNIHSARAAENARQIVRRFVTDDAEVVNLLKLQADQQVMLQVRISEMQRSVIKELGSSLLNTGTDVSIGTGGAVSGSSVVVPEDTFGVIGANLGSIFGLGGNLRNFQGFLNALERRGLVKTLAEPNLTAISGESAKFNAGGEFPIIVPQNNNTNTVEFKEFGVVVTFTPVVLESGAISLRMSAEVSKLSNEGAVQLAGNILQALTVRRTETTVEIPSGGTLVVAGLLRNDFDNTVNGVPFLKDIPILGALFRSTAFNRQETELVISVTPRLVRPFSRPKVALPTDKVAPASDLDMYLLGQLHKVYGKGKKTGLPESAPRGPVGYIVE